MDLETAALVTALQNGTLRALSHEDHVRVAWHYATRLSLPETLLEVPALLQAYARAKGRADDYHETVTFAFLCVIHARVRQCPEASWERFRSDHADLLDRAFLERYYPRHVLDSEAARCGFVLPDPREVAP
ncbi:MAG: hypothetical protein AAF628_31445 [Planctomycetota bacterium]